MLKRFTVSLARAGYGFFLPALILWSLLSSHYQTEYRRQVEQARDQMSTHLEKLELYHADSTFFHGMLKMNFEFADADPEPELALNTRVKEFKKVFGDNIRFMVWNGNGSLLPHLTDEKGFRYLLRTMHDIMHEVAVAYRVGIHDNPGAVTSIASRMNLLRGYFGQFVFLKLLFEPLRPEHLGSAIFADAAPDKRLLWFYPGKNFSVACFVNAKLINQNFGPIAMINSFNPNNDGIKLGFINPLTYETYGLPKLPSAATEIKLEAIKFQRYAQAFAQSDNFLLLFSQASHQLIVLSYFDKKLLPDVHYLAKSAFIRALKWLALAIFVVFCFKLRHPHLGLSVRQRMLLLFVFANGLPMTLLLIMGYEFFNEKRQDLINLEYQKSISILKEFDLRYPSTAFDLARQLNNYIDQKNSLYGSRQWPEHEIDQLYRMITEMDPDESLLINSSGARDFFYAKDGQTVESFALAMFERAIGFFNSADNPGFVGGKSLVERVTSDDTSLHPTLLSMRKFSILNPGSGFRFVYGALLGDAAAYANWGIITVTWAPANFVRTFLPEQLEKAEKIIAPRILGLMINEREQILSSAGIENNQIRRLMRHTRNRKLMTERITLGNTDYLFTSIACNEIPDSVLMTLYPMSFVEADISRTKMQLLVVCLALISSLYFIVRPFLYRFVEPVHRLGLGLECLASGDFKHRISYDSADEFGDLIAAFNSTMADLQTLAVGTAVQVALLPEEKYSLKNIRLFARSVFMTKMGGDYCDYCQISEDRLLVVFGDVAGHGIPAAVVMAMIKAVVTAKVEEGYNGPGSVLKAAQLVFDYLKAQKWRRMMTCQVIEINCSSGEYAIANAGHCFPAFISLQAKAAEFVQLEGLPLGSKKTDEYPQVKGRFKPGESMVLYTDGIVEASNSSEEAFGYNRFRQLLCDTLDDDLQLWWQNIYDSYCSWAACRDDDITMMLLRFDREYNHE